MEAEVEVWFADLDCCLDSADEWERELLSEEERRRASRVCDNRVRERFVIARGILRQLLAERLSIGPSEIAFAYGPFGKPRLAAGGPSELQFNVSHADRWALLAISEVGRVGVDIERCQDIPEWEDMALSCFPQDQRQQLNEAPPEERAAEFVRAWVRREALLKALGWGWAGSAVRYRAPFAPGLSVQDLPSPGGYVASIAHSAGRTHIPAQLWTGLHARSAA